MLFAEHTRSSRLPNGFNDGSGHPGGFRHRRLRRVVHTGFRLRGTPHLLLNLDAVRTRNAHLAAYQRSGRGRQTFFGTLAWKVNKNKKAETTTSSDNNKPKKKEKKKFDFKMSIYYVKKFIRYLT